MSIDNALLENIAFSEGHVQTSQEQIFVLSSSQLRDIISQAVENAIQPLQDRISDLEEFTAKERAFDRKRISALEHSEPQPAQKDRGDILRALLAANNGKLLRSQARKKMHLSESRFSELLATMGEYIETRPYHLNESWKILVLK